MTDPRTTRLSTPIGIRLGLLFLIILIVNGCSTMQLKDFEGTSPELVIEEYFAGDTWAYGLFQNRSGQVVRQFKVHINGYWDGDDFVLDEHFDYSDGETDRRIWRLTPLGEHRYEGRADDVVGVAIGETRGQAFNFRYTLDLPWRNSSIKVNFDDWMLLQPDDKLINRATVSKFGLRVGEVILFFTKEPPR